MLEMTKREYARKPKDYRSTIDGKPYVLNLNPQTGGTELVPVKLKANPTLTTIKSFIRKNPALYISTKSRFDGMVDCVMPCDDKDFSPVQPSDGYKNTLGIAGAWFVFDSRDSIWAYEDEHFKGYEVYNCCGSFILAIKKAANHV